MTKTWVPIAMGLLLAACSSNTEYLYKPFSSFAEYGFKDRQKENGDYWLSFTGTKRTTEEQVKVYWQRRTQELCQGEYTVLDLEAEMQIWTEQHYSSDAVNTFARKTEVKKPYMKGSIRCSAAS